MTKIFPAKNSKGFTLLEILIVITLIGGLSLVVLPRLSSQDRIKSSIRKLNVVIKQTQNQARLSGQLHRLVLDISPNEEAENKDDFKPSFYVEVANSKSAKISFDDSEAAKNSNATDDPPEPEFSIEPKVLKRKEVLPNNYFFDSIEYNDKTVTEGKAYIYFYPQGYVTQAMIHITNKDKINYTIFIHPLTGQTNLFNQKKSLKDLKQ